MIEIESDEEQEQEQDQEEEPRVEPFILPDLARVKLLSEVSDCVEAQVFSLPPSIGGVCLINARAVAGCPEDQSEFDLGRLTEGLSPCIAFDIFRTLIFPQSQADRTQSLIGLAQHRGELQVIHRRTAEFLQQLSVRGYNFVAISFIGRANHRPYVDSLLESCLLALVPVIFIVFDREDKARLAKELRCIAAFDDQQSLIASYKRSGVRAVQVNRQFGLHTHPSHALEWLERKANESASSSGGKKEEVVLRLKRADPY